MFIQTHLPCSQTFLCFVFSTRVSSYQKAKKWKDDIDNKVTLADGRRIPVLLLANKVSNIRQINNLKRKKTQAGVNFSKIPTQMNSLIFLS
jgi:hypothetical protein